MKNIAVIASVVFFVVSVMFGLPKLLPSKVVGLTSREGTPSQQETIAKASASASLLSQTGNRELITSVKLWNFPTNVAPAIFPPDLVFKERPKISEAEKDRIAQSQRIALLENSVRGLETKIELMVAQESLSWKWGWEGLWAVIIWLFGTIATVAVKIKTEEFLSDKGWVNGKKRDDQETPTL